MSRLFKAAQRNDLAGVQRVDPISQQDLQRSLCVALQNDCVSVVQFLLRLFPYKFGWLDVATRWGSAQVIRDAFAPHYDWSSHLTVACLHGHVFAAQRIMQGIVTARQEHEVRDEWNPQTTFNKMQAIHNESQTLFYAVTGGHARVVMWLLRSKVSPHARIGDARETPARPLIEQLQALGADVWLADPHVADHQFPTGVTRVEGNADDLARADVVAFLVDHAEFDNETIGNAPVPILDCRHCLSGPLVRSL